MKKLTFLLAAACLFLLLTSCGKEPPDKDNGSSLARTYHSEPENVAKRMHDDKHYYPNDDLSGEYEEPVRLSEDNGIVMPNAIAVIGENIWVTDHVTNNVTILGPDGQVTKTFGGPGAGKGQFNDPGSIAEDGDGDVYIIDALNFRVQKFDREGNYLDEIVLNRLLEYSMGLGDIPKMLTVPHYQLKYYNGKLYTLHSSASYKKLDCLYEIDPETKEVRYYSEGLRGDFAIDENGAVFIAHTWLDEYGDDGFRSDTKVTTKERYIQIMGIGDSGAENYMRIEDGYLALGMTVVGSDIYIINSVRVSKYSVIDGFKGHVYKTFTTEGFTERGFVRAFTVTGDGTIYAANHEGGVIYKIAKKAAPANE